MHWLADTMSGPWGAVIAGLIVLAVELLLKRVVEGRGAAPTIQQTANTAGDHSPVNQSVRIQGSQIHLNITEVVRDRTQPSPAGSAPATTSSDDDWLKIIGLGVAVFVAAAIVTTALSRYSGLVVNVLFGIAAGTALAALLVAASARRTGSSVPVTGWVITTVTLSLALAWGAWLLPRGAFRGVSLSDVRETTGSLPWWDAVQEVRRVYDIPVTGFFLISTVGAVGLLAVALTQLVTLAGVVTGIAALNRTHPKPWHLELVQALYPRVSPRRAFTTWALVALFALLLVSGLLWRAFDAVGSHSGDVPAPPTPPSSTSSPAPLPAPAS